MTGVASHPTVSVVIPTHDRKGILGNAIASVLEQTFTDLELIVVDDASTDGTSELVRAIPDPRVRYLRLDRNVHAGAALNEGIDVARGRFLALLDSDDAWEPTKLERQLAFVREHAPPDDRWLCYTQARTDNGVDEAVVPARGKRDDETLAEYLFVHDGVTSTITLLLPLELARRVRFHTEPHSHFDWGFCLRLDALGVRFLFLREPLSVWNMAFRDDRVSTSTSSRTSLAWLELHEGMMSKKVQRAFRAKHLTHALRQEGRRFAAFRNIGSALVTRSISLTAAAELAIIALIDDGMHTRLWEMRRAARAWLARAKAYLPARRKGTLS